MIKILPIIFMLLFGMLVASSGCHNATPSEPLAPKKTPSLSDTGLSGTSWRWLYSIGGVSGGISYSPSRTGYNITIRFSNDSLFSFFRDDTLVETALYYVSTDTSDIADYPYFSNRISFQNILLTEHKMNRFFGYGYQYESRMALQQDTLLLEQDITEAFVDRFVLVQ